MKAGFAKIDITPRVGVQLCGFGPYLNRYSIAVRDRLWARAMAVSIGKTIVVLVSCDLIFLELSVAQRIRSLVKEATGLPGKAVMVHCTHTHSGPATGNLIGWGDVDYPYMEILPQKIARACIKAVENLSEVKVSHAEVPCEGIALNREYDRDAPPLEEVLQDDWRPARPERTDTTCHVIKVEAEGRMVGFLSYFGCHPVVCCEQTHYIHGDFPGVATNLLEREHPGAVGLFLQGAQGDVNSCVAHKPEQESLLALDIIAARYANSVRRGLQSAVLIEVTSVDCVLRQATFTRRKIPLRELGRMLERYEADLQKSDVSDADKKVRMATVYVRSLRSLIGRNKNDELIKTLTEVQGIRIGPLKLLATPFEIFQAIKNEVKSVARTSVPLVMGLTNDFLGYAPDKETAKKGGYTDAQVPYMLGQLPFANIHDELVGELLKIDKALDNDLEPSAEP